MVRLRSGFPFFWPGGLLVYDIVPFGVMLPLLILNFVVVAVYVTWTTCPRCGKPVLKNPVRVLNRTVWVYKGVWVPQACTKCGFDFYSKSADRNP
jgi:hypothetical protein